MSRSPFGFHQGSALLKLASFYPRLLDVLLEEVQNCIDKGARMVQVIINQKTRNIAIRDDGDGVSQHEFEQALTSISKTMKDRKKGKLGRFGLGLISPLGKCERFVFTSTSKRDPRAYLEWTFVTKDLEEQETIRGIPMRARQDLLFRRGDSHNVRGTTTVPWRTEVRIEHYTNDRQINRVSLESLREGILDRFGPSMRRNQVVVTVRLTHESGECSTLDIKAKDFEGVKLPDATIEDRSNKSRTWFKLYLARKTEKGRRGKVLVGEVDNDFRFDFSTFVRYLGDGFDLADEAVAALKSGVFEGEILNDVVQLHENRKTFLANEALLSFCAAIEEWFELHGKKHFKAAQEEKQEERYQTLGTRSMRVIEEMLKLPAFSGLLKAIDSFKKGSIGPGHAEYAGKTSPDTSIAVRGNTGRSNEGRENTGDSEGRTPPQNDLPKDRPLTVVGPRGVNRTIVRGHSTGLQLAHVAMPGSQSLWVLDEVMGVLKINVLHPLWLQCEEHNDRSLMRFQEYLMLQALGLQAAPQDWAQFARLVFDELNAPYAYMLVHGDALAGRLPGGRAKGPVEKAETPAQKPTVTRARLTPAKRRARA